MSDDVTTRAQEVRERAADQFKGGKWPDPETMDHILDDVVKDGQFIQIVREMEKQNAPDKSGLTVWENRGPNGQIKCIDFNYFERLPQGNKTRPWSAHYLVCPDELKDSKLKK